MVKRRGPPSQGLRPFLCNQAPDIGAIYMFVVPTIGFKLLCAIVIMRLDRRRLVWTNVTANPTAEWIARQITEAFAWDQARAISLEPFREGWIQEQWFSRVNRLSMMRIMARRMKATTVLA
jgi:hypothetical protein